MKRRHNLLFTILLALIALGRFAAGTAIAQAQVNPPVELPPTNETLRPAQANPANPIELAGVGAQPPFAIQYESHLTVREDRTGSEIGTKRIKILTPSAIQTLSQQQLQFIEGMQKLETVEAFTEKSDGRRIPVDPVNIITRDGASGMQATYVPDLKVRTIIFPDVGVGDTLVMTNKAEILQDEFPGQFTDSDIFPRSQSLSSVEITVEAPVSIDLAVKATGDATTDKVETIGGIRRHTITIVPEPYRPDEPGAISPLDREPALLVSTFHSYEELGQAYGNAALPKTKVTPEIAALAADITKNVAGHRAQAAAIDAWVKKNIRYVAIFLSVGRVVPHDAEAILRNKFGDCKDKATLMTSLLAAKGIASEAALINLGNAYSLPEPPTLVALNHVILYLPEFDLYDDPTANGAAFGVLAAEAYDKPVVRVAASGAKLARTPAMKPEDHTAHATTTVNFAADGTVTGQTQEINTGVLGMGLRFAGGIVQQVGDETVAQRQLQSFNTPGTGHVELGNTAETLDPVGIKSSFKLNDRFKPPAPGTAAIISVGMPLTLRPGYFLLGTRLGGRTAAFVCYAGTQTEDIEATFDPTLPLPLPLVATTIDNPLFTYRSTFKLENRTLKVHRELVSRVPGQVCPADAEAQIAADLDKVRIDVNTAYRFASLVASAPVATPKPQPIIDLKVALTAGEKRQLGFFYDIKADCSSNGFAAVTTVEAPQHGKLSIDHGTGRSNFPQSNTSHFACNDRQSDGTVIAYQPEPGFTGTDGATVDVVYADKSTSHRHYSITVNPTREAAVTPVDPAAPATPPAVAAPAAPKTAAPAPAAIVEVSRVAIADQPLRVGFFYDLNPDCSLVGIPSVRILEQPKSGKVTVENGTGFPAFPASNIRYACNSSRSDGAIVSYTANPGYTGADSLTMEIIYPDGFANKRHYAIDVR
jgi:hypothetical protein